MVTWPRPWEVTSRLPQESLRKSNHQIVAKDHIKDNKSTVVYEVVHSIFKQQNFLKKFYDTI